MTIALGIVVNPKLRQPVLVQSISDDHINIYRMDEEGWPAEGQGYYDTSDPAAHATGFPRVHTPSGVQTHGQGYGTALYTALCLGAHQSSEARNSSDPRFRIGRYGSDGDGVCSMEGTRSSDADIWWSAAKERGLAEPYSSTDTEEGVDATYDLQEDLLGKELNDGRVSEVGRIIVDVEKDISADIFSWQSALDNSLIVADFTIKLGGLQEPESLWRILSEDRKDDITVWCEPEWILGLDVRGLTLDAINLLGVLGQIAKASEEDMLGLRFRWEHGLDPDSDIKQMRLPFKPNSSEARGARQALERAQAIRQNAGWARLAALP